MGISKWRLPPGASFCEPLCNYHNLPINFHFSSFNSVQQQTLCTNGTAVQFLRQHPSQL